MGFLTLQAYIKSKRMGILLKIIYFLLLPIAKSYSIINEGGGDKI